ncbi:hypothetical protein Poli38472_000770 [Pythium oligandrum]|uniref:Cytochrome P450 n=1 Tax=Pythium oligandrum TaxID=41045 RepID=A0A8K1CDR5_PYTOL|nr:hypothetical protein Poli38472_000770 [Pythium oligandrum]|eukprot:TMW60728.1 hypothetical protein Poli38472_000770 [Pythium oligandrum]
MFTVLGGAPSIVLSTEQTFEDVLKTQFDVFVKGEEGAMLLRDLFGEGIFAVDGAKWLHQRKTASHLFTHQMMRDIMATAVMEGTETLCDILERAQRENTAVDLKHLLDALTTEVFTRIGFGVRLGCLDGDCVDPEFLRAFTRCAMAVHDRAQQPSWLWRFKKYFNIGSEKQFAKDFALVNGILYNVIEASMSRIKASDATQEKNLISLFLSRPGEDEEPGPSPKMIRDMAFNFIAAGRVTTAQSLMWFLVMINRHPEVEWKIREELERELPGLVSGRQRVPTMEDIQSLTYLEAAVKESLRLHPIPPLNVRTADIDTTLSDGTFVPAGTRIFIPTYATARMPWIWGDDAAEFKPERWIDAQTGKLVQVSPFKYLVFNAGPRKCLGIKLAMMELKIVLASLLSMFTIKTERDPSTIKYDLSLSLPVAGDLMATIHKPTPKHMIATPARAASDCV